MLGRVRRFLRETVIWAVLIPLALLDAVLMVALPLAPAGALLLASPWLQQFFPWWVVYPAILLLGALGGGIVVALIFDREFYGLIGNRLFERPGA